MMLQKLSSQFPFLESSLGKEHWKRHWKVWFSLLSEVSYSYWNTTENRDLSENRKKIMHDMSFLKTALLLIFSTVKRRW